MREKNIKESPLSDFFESARETARQIDREERLTRKKTLWVEPADLLRLLNPRRSSLVRYLRGKKRVMFDDLAADTSRTAKNLNSDLSIRHYNDLNSRIFPRSEVQSEIM